MREMFSWNENSPDTNKIKVQLIRSPKIITLNFKL